MQNVNEQIAQHSYGRLFAVILMEKHQHKVFNNIKNDMNNITKLAICSFKIFRVILGRYLQLIQIDNHQFAMRYIFTCD